MKESLDKYHFRHNKRICPNCGAHPMWTRLSGSNVQPKVVCEKCEGNPLYGEARRYHNLKQEIICLAAYVDHLEAELESL